MGRDPNGVMDLDPSGVQSDPYFLTLKPMSRNTPNGQNDHFEGVGWFLASGSTIRIIPMGPKMDPFGVSPDPISFNVYTEGYGQGPRILCTCGSKGAYTGNIPTRADTKTPAVGRDPTTTSI